MATIKQSGRFLTTTTPFGEDAALVRSLEGSEGISQLFEFTLELLVAKDAQVDFSKFLGKELTVAAAIHGHSDGTGTEKRYFSGVCRRFAQGAHDKTFAAFQAVIVPKFWLLTKQSQSRIYQHQTVPDILKDVLKNLDVEYSITGTYEPREYCVQYQESDFAFASRLMEEEGIFYFFKHTDTGHKMVVSNSSIACQEVPSPSHVEFDYTELPIHRHGKVNAWRKLQDLKSGKFTVWDTSFQLPGNNLSGVKTLTGSVTAGSIAHTQSLPENQSLEIYEYPGGYAKNFDGIDQSGGEQASNLQKNFQENTASALLLMEQEACGSLTVEGGSNCVQLTSGFKFTLEKHFFGDGDYLITKVRHRAVDSSDIFAGQSLTDPVKPQDQEHFHYSNEFT